MEIIKPQGLSSAISLYLPCDGANNGVIFRDHSQNRHAATPHGVAKTSTGRSKFGLSSWLNAATGYLTIPTHEAFNFGTGNFTVAMWAYPTANNTYQNSLIGWKENSSQFRLTDSVSDSVRLYLTLGNSQFNSSPATGLTLNAWNHIAVTRAGTAIKLFKGGAVIASGTLAGSVAAPDTSVIIGHTFDLSASFELLGNLSDVMIIKGYALWTSAFTPPTRRYIGGIL